METLTIISKRKHFNEHAHKRIDWTLASNINAILNYQIYKYILHLDMQNIYSTQWIRKENWKLEPYLYK